MIVVCRPSCAPCHTGIPFANLNATCVANRKLDVYLSDPDATNVIGKYAARSLQEEHTRRLSGRQGDGG